jgi:hypothetical protein
VPRIKSLLIRVEVDEAQKAHNCQANAAHRLERGARRLKVRNGRSWDHYCAACAALMIQRDIAELQALQPQFPAMPPPFSSRSTSQTARQPTH